MTYKQSIITSNAGQFNNKILKTLQNYEDVHMPRCSVNLSFLCPFPLLKTNYQSFSSWEKFNVMFSFCQGRLAGLTPIITNWRPYTHTHMIFHASQKLRANTGEMRSPTCQRFVAFIYTCSLLYISEITKHSPQRWRKEKWQWYRWKIGEKTYFFLSSVEEGFQLPEKSNFLFPGPPLPLQASFSPIIPNKF